MSDDSGLNVSPEDVEIHVEHAPVMSHSSQGAEQQNGADLQIAQKRLVDVESAHESLKKGMYFLGTSSFIVGSPINTTQGRKKLRFCEQILMSDIPASMCMSGVKLP